MGMISYFNLILVKCFFFTTKVVVTNEKSDSLIWEMFTLIVYIYRIYKSLQNPLLKTIYLALTTDLSYMRTRCPG